MEAQWRADRLHLRTLLTTQPGWTLDDLAAATGRSRSWVKKCKQRLRAAPDDVTILHSQSRARTHPPPALSQIVIDRILGIRDAPPHNLKRIPGPKAILYYLQQEATTTLSGERGCYVYLSWTIRKPHSTAVNRSSRVRGDGRKQMYDFCVPTSFGLFVR